jgi:hypothetical protein
MLAEFAGSAWRFLRICQKSNVKLYVHVHGYDVSVNLQRPEWAERYNSLFKRASGIIAPSRFLADSLAQAGCSRKKLHVSQTASTRGCSSLVPASRCVFCPWGGWCRRRPRILQ